MPIPTIFSNPFSRPKFPETPAELGPDGQALWTVARNAVKNSGQRYGKDPKVIPGLGKELFQTAFQDKRYVPDESKAMRLLVDDPSIRTYIGEPADTMTYRAGFALSTPAVANLIAAIAATGHQVTTSDVVDAVKQTVVSRSNGALSYDDQKAFGLLKHTAGEQAARPSEETDAYLEAASVTQYGHRVAPDKDSDALPGTGPHWSENPYYLQAADAIDAIQGVTPPDRGPFQVQEFITVVDQMAEELQSAFDRISKGEAVDSTEVNGLPECNQAGTHGDELREAYWTGAPRKLYWEVGQAASLANQAYGWNANSDQLYITESKSDSLELLSRALALLENAKQVAQS